jgi:DNA-binding MarR family transcriptional regulator
MTPPSLEMGSGTSIARRGHSHAGLQTDLEALFTEASALAVRLRQTAAVTDDRDQLPAGGLRILQILERHGPQTVPQIARLRSTSRQNIQVLVNRLGAEGWVELTDNPAHKSSLLVRLTLEKGRRGLEAAAEREARLLKDLLLRFSEAEVVGAIALLRRLRLSLAGNTRPPAGGLKKATVPKRARHIPQRVRRDASVRALAPAKPAQPQPPPVVLEEAALNENELPVSLL